MRFIFILLLFPIKLFSQDLQGVWTGSLYNDTTRKYIPYEIAITESKGKLTGFSHTIFTDENNRSETGVKSLKIKKKGDKFLIEDDELIYNNYLTPPPKGVRQYSELNFTSGPSGEYLVGAFNTNRTREYAPATGSIRLRKKENIEETKIIPELNELKLSGSLSFMKQKSQEKNVVAVIAPVVKKNTPPFQSTQQLKDIGDNLPKTQKETGSVIKIENEETLIGINEDTVDYKVEVTDIQLPVKAKEIIVKQTTAAKKSGDISSQKEKVTTFSLPPKATGTITINQPKITAREYIMQQAAAKKVEDNSKIKEKEIITLAQPKATNVLAANAKTNESIQQPIIKKSESLAPLIPSEELAKRKIETIRTVEFKSDSLTLTLYDNGVVDGDTVSVILNGKIIMPNEGLSTKAITKTIYITPDIGDSLQLIMYAENLGSIAPNTGLLIIKDGEESYQIRFSGDLQKNSAIILKRKKSLSQ